MSDVLHVVAKPVAAAEADLRILSVLFDVLVHATKRQVPEAPVAAPRPSDPIVTHQRAIARLAAATVGRQVVLDAAEAQIVARLLPLLTRPSPEP